MKNVKVLHIDAFSSIPDRGNPAGVVLNGKDFSEQEMQQIAKKIGFNETAFILPSEVADFRIRYFTPGHEMNLCGHATMGAVFALQQECLLQNSCITIETLVGVLPIKVQHSSGEIRIHMQHAKPQFIEFTGSVQHLAAAIGLSLDEIDHSLPIVYGSTGTWTLIVPIKQLSSFQKMKPKTEQFPEILLDMPKSSVHPICFEVRDVDNDMHARHFSSPYSGTVEDAVTGTGSGVMGAYYKQYVHPSVPLPTTFKVEQGHEINKDGLVYVHLEEQSQQLQVSISGTAVFVKNIEINL
ncbi:MAG: PhzF family phenazine biosynthesis isomerase [Solibacillus sp.]|uniref:PhzF family phenazine biosynthesis isomerase n=1 Tax=Solibacillus sp. TaxID=1909654 RepID=UPI003314DA36